MKEFLVRYKENFLKVFEYALVIFIIILSVQKGGFYKNDVLAFNLVVTLIGILYILIKLFINKKEAIKRDNILIALLILSFSYLLPIIFNNYTSFSDAFFEFIRYFDVAILYLIVKNSKNKKKYINSIITVAILQCILGIDELGTKKFENVLYIFNSGYLTKNFGRMSGTIQYANTTAIIIGISTILIIKNIDELLKNNKNSLKNEIKICILNCTVMFLITCIILTASRFASLIFIVASIILIIFEIKNKRRISIYFVINLIYSLLVSSYIQNIITIDKSKIYIAMFLGIVAYLLIFILINFVFSKLINKVLNKKSNIFIVIGMCLILLLYLILNFLIPCDLKLDSNKKVNYNLDVYADVKQNENKLIVNFNEKNIEKEQFKLTVDLYEVSNSGTESLILSQNYDNTNYNSTLNFNINDDYKCLRFRINCNSSKISIKNITLNDKNYKVNYLLIPYEFISRIQDGFTGSNSIDLRITYLKDALKISTSSIKNFIFGSGGEAFRNLFNMYKTEDYYSTEVHNAYIQIFCEAGIIGFVSIIFIFIFSLIKSRNNHLKICLFMLLIHNILDLNFSYMIALVIFSILLGCQEFDNDKIINNKIVLKIIYLFWCVFLVFSIFIFYKLLCANLASEMEDIKNSNDVKIYEIEQNINYYNLRFNLDKTEYKYIKKLIESKEGYILYLKNNLMDENFEILKSQIKDINNLADYMLKNDKYNKTVIFLVCDIYYRNIENFSLVYFDKDIEMANEYYSKIILEHLNNVKKYFPLNKEVNEKVNKYISTLNLSFI